MDERILKWHQIRKEILKGYLGDSVGAREIKQITEMLSRNHHSDGASNFKAQV